MGSGIGSNSHQALLDSIRSVFEAVQPSELHIDTQVVPLAQLEAV